MTPPAPAEVAEVINSYPSAVQAGVLQLRALIFEVGRARLAGPVEETLRWGQPSYIAPRGSTLRLGPHKAATFALFAHCQSRVIPDYAAAFPGWDQLDGTRAVLFDTVAQIEPERLSQLIGHALSYHAK